MTEWLSDVNIPACQLMIGMGIRLERMADIRCLFGKDPSGSSAIGMCLHCHQERTHSVTGHCALMMSLTICQHKVDQSVKAFVSTLNSSASLHQ